MVRQHTHYDNLRVARSAPPEVIRAAYKALSQRYHPDKNSSADATRIMKILNEAYAVLGDAESRRRYDETLSAEAAEPARETANETPRAETSDFQKFNTRDSEWVYTRKGFEPGRAGAAPKLRHGWMWAGGILLVVVVRLLTGGNGHADNSAPAATPDATGASSDTVSQAGVPTSGDHLGNAVSPLVRSGTINSSTTSAGASESPPTPSGLTSTTQAHEQLNAQGAPLGETEHVAPSAQSPGPASAALATDDGTSPKDAGAAELAARWAQASVQAQADIDMAYASAVRSLPAVSATCPDSVVLRQTPRTAGPFKPVIVLLSQRCGYAISYWPDTDEQQASFERSEIDGWAGYCSLPMGTKTVCTRNGQT
ncbi:DnaJ domain-containing protein [Burkholderia sp. WP9]|uniref:J domain-containing protein n=1 Tax=Burkholderia sp. WP9 TaxID=1500263 RepID=UPI00089A92D5|nr:J domain-containing protein [Burkholderia sp. WP9]SEF12051.1 DnaJ domain-containing protein [Burkholderia sp. WP9]